MAIRDVLTYPNPFLRLKAEAVTNFGDALEPLIRDMAETMWDEPGIGLAAPQVGESLRLFVYDLEVSQDPARVQVVCNPEITLMEGVEVEEEGCLSVPGFHADVKRALRVVMTGQDRHGEALTLDVTGLHARLLQHESDHLNGILFIDHLSALKRGMFKRRLRKALAEKTTA